MSQHHDEFSELLGVYALDAVDPDEREAIERHLADCPRCRAEVQDHREVAALLASSGADAPAGLWDRIAGTLDEAPPPLQLHVVGQPTTARDRRPRAVRWLPTTALAAAAALLIAVLGVEIRDQDHRIDELQAAMVDPLLTAYEQALADPASKVIELGDGTSAVVTRDGGGYLRASSLPRLGADRTYQLWGRVGAELVSLGVLGSKPEIVPFEATSVTLLAITEEVAGGVVRSAAVPVVSGVIA
jgi:anti-sigma factor RsiW